MGSGEPYSTSRPLGDPLAGSRQITVANIGVFRAEGDYGIQIVISAALQSIYGGLV